MDVEQYFGGGEVHTNEHGAKQSKLEYRFDLIEPCALKRLAHIVWYGAERYGVGNWKNIPLDDNLNHALYHINEHMGGDNTEDHLGHAFARLMFAIYLQEHGTLVEQAATVKAQEHNAHGQRTFTMHEVIDAFDRIVPRGGHTDVHTLLHSLAAYGKDMG